jgi:tetratricopeptide (TPR) repeat protein
MLTYLGRDDEALDLLDAASADLAELGLRLELAVADTVRAIMADARGDLAEAERGLRRSYERFRETGDAANSGVIAVDLADVLSRMGRHDDALEMAETGAGLAAEADVEAQVGWRMAAARVHAERGDAETALRLQREAVDRLEATDLVVLRADTLDASADVFASLGRHDVAIERLESARAIYAAKGHVVGERDALRALGALRARQPS